MNGVRQYKVSELLFKTELNTPTHSAMSLKKAKQI